MEFQLANAGRSLAWFNPNDEEQWVFVHHEEGIIRFNLRLDNLPVKGTVENSEPHLLLIEEAIDGDWAAACLLVPSLMKGVWDSGITYNFYVKPQLGGGYALRLETIAHSLTRWKYTRNYTRNGYITTDEKVKASKRNILKLLIAAEG